ncbi:dihydrofolate reductase family protein [Kocuria massiliensis]|uniref:dihydrofolate reductase family protein n=1 Tax=Kocuria massiliensis TaxID=1926282 RepID=UPI0022B9A13A|nr:dihydrofolate reductase family protein [Kocuria massiliensis]
MSRRITANLFTTLDGAVENPSSWQGDAFDEILGEVMTETLSAVDDVLLGRETYDFWASHWTREDVEDPFKSFINPVAKHVASRTLKQKDVTWENCSVIDGDLMDFVRGLKGTQGRDISIQGSLSIIAQLLEAGLLDRLTLFVHPVFAGPERRLSDSMNLNRGALPLMLLDHRVNTKGTTVLVFGPAERSFPANCGEESPNK